MSLNELVSLEEAAKLLGVPTAEVEAMVQRGTLPGKRGEGGVRIFKMSIDNYLRKQRKPMPFGGGFGAQERKSVHVDGMRGLEDKVRRQEFAKQRIAGVQDAQVKDRESLELDLSVLGELKVPERPVAEDDQALEEEE